MEWSGRRWSVVEGSGWEGRGCGERMQNGFSQLHLLVKGAGFCSSTTRDLRPQSCRGAADGCIGAKHL